MSGSNLGPRPSFVGCDDYQQLWRDQAKPDSRYSREELLSESGEDPDELRSLPYQQYLRSKHWDIVRRRSLAVAENRCFYCGAKNSLDVHHLTYKRRGCELDEDLIVLCRTCHTAEHLTQNELEEARHRAELSRAP